MEIRASKNHNNYQKKFYCLNTECHYAKCHCTKFIQDKKLVHYTHYETFAYVDLREETGASMEPELNVFW